MKVYEKHYALTSADTLETEVFALDFPQEAVISKLTIQQTAGAANIAYGAVLYNSDVTGGTPESNVKFTVVPEQNALAGDAVALFQGLYLHKNVEGGPTVPVRKIYLQLNTPDETVGDETWDVALAGEVVIQ